MRRAQDRARRSSITEREARRSNRGHLGALKLASKARDEKVRAKRADFFGNK